MASTVVKRGVVRAAFTKVYNGLLDRLKEVNVDLVEVNGRFKLLEGKFLELVQFNEKIQAELFESNPSEFETALLAEIESCDEYELKYQTIKCRVDSLMCRSDPTIISNENHSNPEKRARIKLPELRLRPYSGEISQWIAFWSQFSCIDQDESLTDEQKFQYLIQATSAGSRARALVDSFPPSGKNYSKVIEALKDRFGRSDLLIEHYVRALLQLVVSKQGMKLCELYDSLKTQVRALESLDIVSDQYAALLFPLIESCIPVDILKVWQRTNTNRSASLKSQLDGLMEFLKTEVVAEERVAMAANSAPLNGKLSQSRPSRSATAADLANLSIKDRCVFCQGVHTSADCDKAASMSFEEKKAVLEKTRACFGCARLDHPARRCRAKCPCGGRHIILLCPKKKQSEYSEPNCKPTQPKSGGSQEASLLSVDHILSVSDCSEVFLQTFAAVLYNGDKQRKVRVLVDSGSQRSYILRKLAQDLDYEPIGEENLVHSLFGGGSMGMVRHISYKIRLRSLKNEFACNFTALDQGNIAAFVPQVVADCEVLQELTALKISLVEDSAGPIDVLIGADIAGKIWSGNRKVLSSGVVAVETQFGWTLMGVNKKKHTTVNSGLAMTCTMVSILSGDESDLWKFEAIGICDPIEKSSRDKRRVDALEHFKNTVEFVNGRYRVRLPWNEMLIDLSSNRALAEKRLAVTKRRMADDDKLFHEYDQIFKDWMKLNIIEETTDDGVGHYLPHRPVVKESSSTTKVRPVFDASAKLPGRPSLNDCLESGPNMIELIPDILIGFRKHRVGVSSDIEKAFLQIEVHPIDREYLKFLWTTADQAEPGVFKTVTMRHNRVVFGVTCSPFLLAAVIDYHVDRMVEKAAPEVVSWLRKMKKSFYVDNLACSFDTADEVLQFKGIATEAMAEGGFNLRGWEYSQDGGSDSSTLILGLKWDRQQDVLHLNMDWWQGWTEPEGLTKRSVYSMVQKIYDPIGFCAPVTVNLKLLIQTLWEKKLDWDDKLDKETIHKFSCVLQNAHLLRGVAVTRCLGGPRNQSLHLFCDASARAYAACIFLRSETEDGRVLVNLVQAKSKIVNANICPTMPRLELMGVVIGVRLLKSVRDALDWKDVPVYGWSDSSTALAWIQRQEEWSVFVRNRVREIREIGLCITWRHVPGQLNPADLPSRGCTIEQLLKVQWWEGPSWLYDDEAAWPQSHCTYMEDEVSSEKVRKATVSCLAGGTDHRWLYQYFSKFEQIVRMVSFIKRFIHNCRNKLSGQMKQGDLSVQELSDAENVVWRLVQEECFNSLNDKMISNLRPFKDETGVIRVKTKIAEREDFRSFTTPVLLPHNHPVVERMVVDRHARMGHVGAQTLWTNLREYFWVLKGRQLSRQVVRKCVTCRRFGCKNFDAESPPLPHSRVTDGSVFEVCGVDYAGPVTLYDGQKAWIALFTCGVYRAVHLEIVTSLSTDAFLLALRRFVARRGRPRIMYSDNGTCFRGADNAFSSIDWDEISRVCAVERICWRFNPPSAAWWGGFYERMVQTVKRVLRRILGKASLTLEELYTTLCECESHVNSRPITYISEDNEDPLPLTPALFMKDIQAWETADCDAIDRESLNRRLQYRQSLRDQLRDRFRMEYLGCLSWTHRRGTREPFVGEVVLVGSDDVKRVDWPLARVEKVIRGNDGRIRVLHLKTAKGEWTRPLQRVFPLEIDVAAPRAEVEVFGPAQPMPEVALDVDPISHEDQQQETDPSSEDEGGPSSQSEDSAPRVTRHGRRVKKPSRLDL